MAGKIFELQNQVTCKKCIRFEELQEECESLKDSKKKLEIKMAGLITELHDKEDMILTNTGKVYMYNYHTIKLI